MAFKLAEDSDSYPVQIYLVDSFPNPKVLGAAKKFGLPIVTESNNNVMPARPLTRTIYIFNDFEKHKMFRRIEKTPHNWILGPTALEEMSNNRDLELRRKPTYCTCMYPFVFYINCIENIPLMKRMVELIKWMGGRFVMKPNVHTTHMITTSSLAKGYTYCYTFNVPILTPAWVEYCWKQRNIPNFNPSDVMEKFRIAAFLDLFIAIKGFDSEDAISITTLAASNGAVVVEPDDLRCTHLVLSSSIASHVNINDIPTHIPYVVHEGWFISSMEQNLRDYEDRFLCFKPKEIRKSIWAIVDADERNKKRETERPSCKASLHNEDEIMLETAKKKTQDVKRKYAFEDLLLKEKNYLHCLRQLLDIKILATDEHQPGGSILNQAEAKIIFGNLENLVEIHQELVSYFEDILMNWKNDAVTVRQVVMLKDELFKQYETYTNNYSESKKLIEACETKNKRFRTLLRTPMKNKERPKDIFIRPIQRLCSLVLQLQEMNKNTREDNRDKKVLNEAILVVKDVLQKINNSQEMVEKLQIIFDIHRRIKDCPPDLVTCHRDFILQFPAEEGNTNLMFFLFNDILEITKVRNKSQAALKTDYSSDSLKRKPYKHIASLPLSIIINVVEFEGKKRRLLCTVLSFLSSAYIHHVISRYSHRVMITKAYLMLQKILFPKEENKGSPEVFGFNIKDVKNEGNVCMHCFQYSDGDYRPLKEILLRIAEQLVQRDSSMAPRDFILTSVPITRIDVVPITTKTEEKTMKKVWDLLKVPTCNKNQIKTGFGLRKSLSCGDLIDPKNAL